MEYRTEIYKNCERFNEQYQSIYQFLLEAEKLGYNEHFPWGRFEWMHAHSYLDEDKLTSIVMFKDENDAIVGLITYDTDYGDRAYLIHTSSDRMLLDSMIDAAVKQEDEGTVIKANARDVVLCQMLQERGFARKHRDACVLTLDLNDHLEYTIPPLYTVSPRGFSADPLSTRGLTTRAFPKNGIRNF